MIRIICPKCKNAYLNNNNGALICPDCQQCFDQKEENLLCGAQYYTEGDYDKANDCLMKYIVQNGADSQAIFYKALCDASAFDEDTVSLNDAYDKLLQCLKELPEELFPTYLALANDEAQRLEKAVAEAHINLFVEADAEKIKKEVSTIINLQNEAKTFRIKLNALVNDYNETAAAKISVRFSDCFLVDSTLATRVGDCKFEKISENIASHTVFTGILSTDIKNLEIYYRCIVMFFKKNREKYEFLMASAEKFNQLSALLEEGQYASIKGTSAIGDKLKSAGYDFFQESLKDHDDEFEAQKETVVVIEVEEAPVEEVQLEDISSSSFGEEATVTETETTDIYSDSSNEINSEEAEDISSIEEITEYIEDSSNEANGEEASEDIDSSDEAEEETTEELEEALEEVLEEEPDAFEEFAEEASAQIEASTEANEPEINAEATENETVSDYVVELSDNAPVTPCAPPVITEEAPKSNKNNKSNAPKKRKKSIAPFIAIILVLVAIIAVICVTIIPAKLQEKNYNDAKQLMSDKKYQQSAEAFALLEDYEDSEELAIESEYLYAKQLEESEKYEEAKLIFEKLGTYEDSMARHSSCVYNIALITLENGSYDEAKAIFETIPTYLDSSSKVSECDYQKAVSLVNNKEYEGAIDIFTSLGAYSNSTEKILDAKYKYVKDNLSKDNETTLAFIDDLIEERYLDIVAIRRDLLGPTEEEKPNANDSENASTEKIATCINYNEADYTENLEEVVRTKPIYFHVTVNDETLYGKNLTVKFTTSVGYTEPHTVTFSKINNTYDCKYPRTDISNYTVEFEVVNDGKTIASQTVTIK